MLAAAVLPLGGGWGRWRHGLGGLGFGGLGDLRHENYNIANRIWI